MRAAIDMKCSVNTVLTKYNKLNITFTQPLHSTEQTTPIPPVKSGSSYTPITEQEWKFGSDTLHKLESRVEVELDPTTPHAQLVKLKKARKLKT